MPHHSVDQKVEQALTEIEARRRMNRLGIESPFMRCPHLGCDHGWIEHFDLENASRWYSLCPTCEGSGQVLAEAPAPDFVIKLRDWWAAKRKWWREDPVAGLLKLAGAILIGSVIFYAFAFLRSAAGLLEWRP